MREAELKVMKMVVRSLVLLLHYEVIVSVVAAVIYLLLLVVVRFESLPWIACFHSYQEANYR